MSRELDCIVIGYNEVPFSRYESFLRHYGEDAEAYRDLKFSFVDLGEKKLDYVGLMNHVSALATGNGNGEPIQIGRHPESRCCLSDNLLETQRLQRSLHQSLSTREGSLSRISRC